MTDRQIKSLSSVLCVRVCQQALNPGGICFIGVMSEGQGGNVLDPDPARKLLSKPSAVSIESFLAGGWILSGINAIVDGGLSKIP